MTNNAKPSIAVQLYSLRHLSDSFTEIAAAAAAAGFEGVELILCPTIREQKRKRFWMSTA